MNNNNMMARYYKALFNNDPLVLTFTLFVVSTVLVVFLLGTALDGPSERRFLSLNNRVQFLFPHSNQQSINCTPTNIHLAPKSDVDLTNHTVSMTMSFTLPQECDPSKILTHVNYGRANEEFQTIPAETLQFTYSRYVRSYQSSWIHHVIFQDLIAGGELYWYQIEAKKNEDSLFADSWNSSVFTFATPPLPMEPVTVALIGDWGGSPEALRTMQGMTNASLVVIAGDISYANAHLPQWEEWFSSMQDLWTKIPSIVAAGNHEIECNRKTFQVFQAYENYFRNPNRIAAPRLDPIPFQFSDCIHPAEFWTTYWYGNSFYSYRHGLLQIIVLNSYTDSSQGSVQYKWLQEELARVDRSITPWLMVVFHSPLHIIFKGHGDEENSVRMLQYMEPLFVQYQVNILLSGHSHAYVRTYPMVGTQVSSRGPIHLTIGTGGDSMAGDPSRSNSNLAWVAHRDNTEFGFGQLQIVNATHAYFERVLNNENYHHYHPDAMDSVWIDNIIMS